MGFKEKKTFFKDEVARYEILKEMERQGISGSDHEKYEELEWRYCKMCKKVVEPTPSQKFLMTKAKLARKIIPKTPTFMMQAGGQVCPHCGARLIPKEIRRNRYCCVFLICLWVIIMIPVFSTLAGPIAGPIGGISFWVLLIGFAIYFKLTVEPRLKKKMHFG